MANNGIYYSSGNTLNFTTNNTTWMNLSSGGTLTVNNIDFDTTPNVPAPTGGTVYFDSNENALSYKPITLLNDVTVNLGQESLIRLYNNLGYQINNGQALHITGATSGTPTVSLAVGTGGDAVQFQISGIATHDIPDSSFGFMTVFGVVRDINLTGFTVGEQVYLSQTVPGAFASYSELSFTGRTCEVGHVLDNSASGKIQVTILNEIEGTIITTQENNILAANNSSTGIFQFSGLSITTPSGTTFNVGAVEGWIIDNVTAPANPTIQLIIYPGSTGNTALYVSSATETYILLTSGLTLIQQTTFPTPQQRRQNLYLGKFGHGNRQFLINAFNEPDSALSPVSQLRDMFTAVKLINDGVIASANGANLNINTSAGVLYGLGIGYVTNKLNPNSLSVGGQSPATFQYRTQTGGTASNTTLIEPGFYDLNGVRTAITGTKATNQRIYLLQNGQIRVQYGQTEYNQLAAAVAALQNEVFVTFPNFRDNGILIGILSVLSTCTQLNDTSKAQFFSVSKFGELIGAAGGTSTTTLQQAYNNSSEPEITINATLDGFSLKNGTGNADNVSQLLQGINSGGTITSFIRADGAFSGTSIFGTGLTATTATITGQFNANSGVRFSGLSSVAGSRILVSDASGNVAYREDIVKGSGGTTNYVTKWTNTEQIVDSNIYADGNFVGIGTNTQVYQEILNIAGDGGIASNSFIFVGHTSGSIAIADANYRTWGTVGNEIAIGTGSPLLSSVGSGNIAIGASTLQSNTSGVDNVAIGNAPLLNNQSGQGNVAIGYNAGANVTSGSYNVLIGYSAGSNITTEDNKLHISNETYGTLIYGEFDNGIVNINGTLSATTYDNLPGSSSANCVTTFFVTNISGCSPVNVLSPLNVKDGLSVTGTSTFTSGLSASTFSAGTYQNLPSFNSVQINGITQFSGDTNNYINFSGINITITSAATNTLVFSAGTGGGGGGISGGGTTNYIPKFTSSTGIGNSLLQESNGGIFINQGYGSSFNSLLDISSSGDTGIGARGTLYAIRGILSGTTIGGAAIRGEANNNQTGVYGISSGDAVGEYIGVTGYGVQAGLDDISGTYIGGKFYGDNSVGSGYSVQLQDGTEGTGKFLVSHTSDGKARWASFGYGITNRAVSLTSTQVFATGTTTINAATYIDINGCSVTLAAGTWLITGHVVIAAANLIIQGFVAITTAANTVVAASALSRPASGTASLNSPLAVSWSVLVSPSTTTTYKLRAARGLTTHTSTYTVYNGTGFNTASHANDGSNLGTNILAIRIA